VVKKKVQVLVRDEHGSHAILRSFLEDHGYSVGAAPERKSPRYKGKPRRSGGLGANNERNPGANANTQIQDLFEGTVKLVVLADQRVRTMVKFIDQLRQHPEFRLLLMESTQRGDSVNIILGLREPIAVGDVLMAMDGVSGVEISAGADVESSEPVLQVTLG